MISIRLLEFYSTRAEKLLRNLDISILLSLDHKSQYALVGLAVIPDVLE